MEGKDNRCSLRRSPDDYAVRQPGQADAGAVCRRHRIFAQREQVPSWHERAGARRRAAAADSDRKVECPLQRISPVAAGRKFVQIKAKISIFWLAKPLPDSPAGGKVDVTQHQAP